MTRAMPVVDCGMVVRMGKSDQWVWSRDCSGFLVHRQGSWFIAPTGENLINYLHLVNMAVLKPA